MNIECEERYSDSVNMSGSSSSSSRDKLTYHTQRYRSAI